MKSEKYYLELEKVTNVAEVLRKDLLNQLFGKSKEGWSCCCGAIKKGAGKVVDISIPSRYEYQIPFWLMWSVNIRENEKTDLAYHWSCGLSEFISTKDLEKLFSDSFKDIDCEYLENEYFNEKSNKTLES